MRIDVMLYAEQPRELFGGNPAHWDDGIYTCGRTTIVVTNEQAWINEKPSATWLSTQMLQPRVFIRVSGEAIVHLEQKVVSKP